MNKLYTLGLLATLMVFIGSTKVADRVNLTIEQPRTVQVYPNPATSVIYFEFPSGLENNSVSLHIYNFIGTKMNEIQVNNNKLSVQLDNYTRGLYVYQIRDRQGSIVESGKFQVVK